MSTRGSLPVLKIRQCKFLKRPILFHKRDDSLPVTVDCKDSLGRHRPVQLALDQGEAEDERPEWSER
ncbi:hypothetical protein BDBG_01400 [Blastomyces gilchristii SLH14081]|uniref:Uncharacterized protein n=1 Tax=Blastomyces gilchristii (strain SLH14081) TaxID=559298 RepID=A0A179UCZ8_BLAGS|nr:uncharacterized protein BDBG_01400 [Blastomyces gilchristii SLH14081]EQL33457.1 hypothetical protein BDFG_04600 [Blastomyces dermatitidis ATCC 26199]OAT04921.1 hypothetical protein BDBG_01400 [Blastomyces gilchristii SLH14081]